eukprot:6369542-Amphidinium_carterae.1
MGHLVVDLDKELVDSLASEFEDLWSDLCISYNHFARTTDAKHRRVVLPDSVRLEHWRNCTCRLEPCW